jgi:hypothetical protein
MRIYPFEKLEGFSGNVGIKPTQQKSFMHRTKVRSAVHDIRAVRDSGVASCWALDEEPTGVRNAKMERVRFCRNICVSF